jgi:HSP20 family molecular chaperone IbpA
LTHSEQKLLNKIKYELKNAKLNKTLYIIHNLMTYTTIEQVETYIKDILLKSATFELEKHDHIDVKTQTPNGVRFYEKYTTQPIFHLIFANEYSEAGKYYNNYTLSFLENSFEKIVGLGGFDVLNTIKKRFKEISKDIIENLKDEIVFDDTNKNLIKLKKPQKITLKRCFIDELGFSNIRASGFTPNYSYYFHNINKQIIIEVEAPGNCNLDSSISFNGEYIIIKIKGKKTLNEKQAINNGREFGNFSLDIPLKLRDLYIKQSEKELVFKNQEPKIEKKDGIFTIVYQLEESILTGGAKY